MFFSIDKSIPFVVVQNRGDGDVKAGLTDMTWDSLVGLLTTHETRKSKNGMAIIPARFKPVDEWRLSEPMEDQEPTFRNQHNIEAITMAIIDLDVDGALDVARNIFAPYEHVVYSTHSYTSATPYKFRLVLKLDEEIKAEDWPIAFKCLLSQIDMDRQCGNLSRIYYLPSVSPDAGVKGVAYHNKGRAIKLSEIYAMAGESVDFSGAKQIERRARRHFVGQNMIGSNMLERLEWQWESMKNRHEEALKELSFSNSRHAFACSVTSSEVARFKSRIDIPSVVQFMYKASAEYSSKPMSQGNTHKELPELFHSAFVKYAKEGDGLAELQARTGMSLKQIIENAVGIASLAQATGRWPIEERVTTKTTVVQSGVGELRRVFADDMRAFLQHGSALQYFKSLVRTNISVNERPDCDLVSSFFIETYSNYLKKHRPELNNRVEMKKAITEISESKDLSEDPQIAPYHRFLNASLKKTIIKQSNQMAMGM